MEVKRILFECSGHLKTFFFSLSLFKVCFFDVSTVEMLMDRRKFVRRTSLEKDHPTAREHK